MKDGHAKFAGAFIEAIEGMRKFSGAKMKKKMEEKGSARKM